VEEFLFALPHGVTTASPAGSLASSLDPTNPNFISLPSGIATPAMPGTPIQGRERERELPTTLTSNPFGPAPTPTGLQSPKLARLSSDSTQMPQTPTLRREGSASFLYEMSTSPIPNTRFIAHPFPSSAFL